MKKFLNRLFSGIFGRKRRKMFTENDLKRIENQFKNIQSELIKMSDKSDNIGVKQAYKGLMINMNASLQALENIREVQSEVSSDVKKFKNFGDV